MCPDISPGLFLLRIGDLGSGENGFLVVVFHTNRFHDGEYPGLGIIDVLYPSYDGDELSRTPSNKCALP